MSDTQTVFRWAMIENVATLICATAGAYYISPWCFLILLNLNSVKFRKREK